jgi:methylamine---glutamate N-methyltransferase subunit A
MCGIVGLFAKTEAVEQQLGALLGEMLGQLADRGPDSAGIALYRAPAAPGYTKLSLFSADPDEDWTASFGSATVHASHAVVELEGSAEEAVAHVRERFPHLRVMSAGERIEIFKEAGDPREFVERFGLAAMAGTHGLGHTRMATESRVTTEGAHPFSTGLDLCLVHNGSLSNHNRLRRMLRREGISFQTENDTEVAAGFLEWRLREGDTLQAALERCLVDLDGFYTFAVGTADGFAVLRDPIACKPAVMAESDDWVAMASEYRAIAVLPGADTAAVWEPEPARVYSWERSGDGETGPVARPLAETGA